MAGVNVSSTRRVLNPFSCSQINFGYQLLKKVCALFSNSGLYDLKKKNALELLKRSS